MQTSYELRVFCLIQTDTYIMELTAILFIRSTHCISGLDLGKSIEMIIFVHFYHTCSKLYFLVAICVISKNCHNQPPCQVKLI